MNVKFELSACGIMASKYCEAAAMGSQSFAWGKKKKKDKRKLILINY